MKKFHRATLKAEDQKNPLAKKYFQDNPGEEIWMNDIYQVNIRRGLKIADGMTMAHLSIKRLDKRALMDWRHMQYIKNELVGEENEGCELFPAESRLVDGANQYHLWVFEDPEARFSFGFTERMVTDVCVFGETQRKFEWSRIPHDLKENNEKMIKMRDNVLNNGGPVKWE